MTVSEECNTALNRARAAAQRLTLNEGHVNEIETWCKELEKQSNPASARMAQYLRDRVNEYQQLSGRIEADLTQFAAVLDGNVATRLLQSINEAEEARSAEHDDD